MLVYQRVNLMGRWWLTIGFWATKNPKAWDANNAILPVSSGRKQCFPDISFAQLIFCDPPKPTNFWQEFPTSISTTLQALQSSTIINHGSTQLCSAFGDAMGIQRLHIGLCCRGCSHRSCGRGGGFGWQVAQPRGAACWDVAGVCTESCQVNL